MNPETLFYLVVHLGTKTITTLEDDRAEPWMGFSPEHCTVARISRTERLEGPKDQQRKVEKFHIHYWSWADGQWQSGGNQPSELLCRMRVMLDCHAEELNERMLTAAWLKSEYNRLAAENELPRV